MANGIVNDIANDVVNALNNGIARGKANSPVHVEVNDLANFTIFNFQDVRTWTDIKHRSMHKLRPLKLLARNVENILFG
jgi:hypothetical protein